MSLPSLSDVLGVCFGEGSTRSVPGSDRRVLDKRFWDMRRWKLDLNEPAMGMRIESAGGALKYTEFEVEPRSYQSHMYYGPIPETEVLKWSNLDQNKGW